MKKNNQLLILIIILGTWLRLWGIDFGLPLTNIKHDELYIMNAAMKFGSGDFNPHFFNYPSLYLYILFISYGVYYIVAAFLGRFSSPFMFLEEYTLAPVNFFLINRLLSVLASVATIWILYILTKRLFTKNVALIAAIFMSSAYLPIREAHFGKIDTAATLSIVLAFWFIDKIRKKNTHTNYLAAALAIGLAISIKYTAVLLVVPLFIVHIFKLKNIRLTFNRKLISTGLVIILGFFAGTPFALIDSGTFYSDLVSLAQTAQHPWYDVDQGIGWQFHLYISLLRGVGLPLLILALIGLILLAKRGLHQAVYLISFPFSLYLAMGNSRTVFARYMLPIIPFICIWAAYAAIEVVKYSQKRTGKLKHLVITYFLLIITIAPSLLHTIQFNTFLDKDDNRLLAKNWILTHLPPGSVAQIGSWLGIIQIPPNRLMLEHEFDRLKLNSLEAQLKKSLIAKRIKESKVLNKPEFVEWTYSNDTFNFLGEAQDRFPDYIILYESPLMIDRQTSPVSPGIIRLINVDYRLLKSFIAYDPNQNQDNLYEHQDAFYLPFSGFSGITRPGPNIYIYSYQRH